MRLNIIGLGRLGKTLSQLLLARQLVEIQAIHSQTKRNVVAFIDEVGQGQAYDNVLDMPRASITMITTPDDCIQSIATKLSMHSDIMPGDIFFHCSGLLSSDALASIRDRGGKVASVHPLKSFSHQAQQNYVGTYCAIEGDEDAVNHLESLFKKIDFIPFRLERDKKVLYHCGAVVASNYLVTLFHEANRCMEEAGVDLKMTKTFILSLMQSSLDNLKKQTPEQALTGPLARGDVETISAHLEVLGEQGKLYRALACATLALTQHNQQKIEQLLKQLN